MNTQPPNAKLDVTRLPFRLSADARRVIARPFNPGGAARITAVLERLALLTDEETTALLTIVLADYHLRHRNIRGIFRQNYAWAVSFLHDHVDLEEERLLLAGAYFTNEYALESVALFNPSMVLHPDQNGVATGAARFIMSLRACGEGHISSIEFRTGILNDVDGAERIQ